MVPRGRECKVPYLRRLLLFLLVLLSGSQIFKVVGRRIVPQRKAPKSSLTCKAHENFGNIEALFWVNKI